MRRYAFSVSIRKLLAIFVTLTLLFAPAAASADAAATVHGQHEMMMMDHSGPCQMPLGGAAGHQKGDGKSCCLSMCIAVAVAPSVPSHALPVRQQVAQFASFKSYQGVPAEIATPPPRAS